jgi:NAD+ synthase
MFDAKKVKDECVLWIRKFFEENGAGCNAVLGISGGKDSSVAAALCVEALGPERVIGVLMPQGEQHDIDMAYMLVNHLNIKHYVVNIKDAVDGILKNIPDYLAITEQARTNLPPRIRMSTLYAVSQSHNGRVSNNCNLSENICGYSTRYGDDAGDFSPLSNLTTVEIVQIGDYLGIPYDLVHKTPMDGLNTNENGEYITDEDILGVKYSDIHMYARTPFILKEINPSVFETIRQKEVRNAFKLKPMPTYNPEI